MPARVIANIINRPSKESERHTGSGNALSTQSAELVVLWFGFSGHASSLNVDCRYPYAH